MRNVNRLPHREALQPLELECIYFKMCFVFLTLSYPYYVLSFCEVIKWIS